MRGEKELKFVNSLTTADFVIAPETYISELCNTLWKYANAKILSADECEQYIEDGMGLVDEFVDSKEIWKEAFHESVKNKHSVYDIFYAITARRNNALLLTNDNALAKICKKLSIRCLY
jgi:predicted nucleic acid-binding protein